MGDRDLRSVAMEPLAIRPCRVALLPHDAGLAGHPALEAFDHLVGIFLVVEEAGVADAGLALDEGDQRAVVPVPDDAEVPGGDPKRLELLGVAPLKRLSMGLGGGREAPFAELFDDAAALAIGHLAQAALACDLGIEGAGFVVVETELLAGDVDCGCRAHRANSSLRASIVDWRRRSVSIARRSE